MRIKSIRIQNFRSFQDETIFLNPYTCFVGPNGAGKSSVLCALNIFFKEQSGSSTDVLKLSAEDYHFGDTTRPILITLTFYELSQSARTELSAYVRGDELVVTAQVEFDAEANHGRVKHFGQRFAFESFAVFFEAEKSGANTTRLGEIYNELRLRYADLPNVRSKDDRINALREYEAAHADECVLIPSEDNFYGINSTGILAQFVQWVFVPAVKNAVEESQETRNTALGKLISRAVSNRTEFDAEIHTLKEEMQSRYSEILRRNQTNLNDLSESLQRRLEQWANPNVRLSLEWNSDLSKAVVLQQPFASIKTGEGDFLTNLARMGHGVQRSYLLALLQELAASDATDAPTLILGCEEPELYQHPPQARHLAEVFESLSTGNNQVLVTTHSPLFVSGQGFENVRTTRRISTNAPTTIRGLTFSELCTRVRLAEGQDQRRRTEGLIAKIHQTLQTGVGEMFFAKIPILVEGLEDVSYITTQLHLENLWSEFRRLGCHIIPVFGKGRIIQPLAIAAELGIPVFVVFDADGNVSPENRPKHENDNRAIQILLGIQPNPFPSDDVWGTNHVIWKTKISDAVKNDFAIDYDRLTEETRQHYAQEGGLEKNGLFIAEWISGAHDQGLVSATLRRLCNAIIDYARSL